MSIKEAIERGPLNRPRTIIVESDADREEIHKLTVESKGLKLLKKAGVPKILTELKKMISQDFPQIEIGYRVDEDRALVTQSLNWDFRIDEEGQTHFKSIRVHALVLTGQIIVERGDDDELLSRKQLRDRAIIEDAIATAYQNPLFLVDFHRKR